MKTILKSLIFLGLTSLSYSQSSNEIKDIKLDKALLTQDKNVSYLKKVENKNSPEIARKLEDDASKFDITKSKTYENTFDTYEVIFKGTNGNIVAAYDDNGKLLNTYEKFENVALPENVKNTVLKEYSDWTIHKTNYLVNYFNGKNSAVKKVYQIQIMKGNDKMNLKIDSEGNDLSIKSK